LASKPLGLRRLRAPKQKTLDQIDPAVRHALETGEMPGDDIQGSRLQAFDARYHDRQKTWETHRDTILAAWLLAHPGTRPHAWWRRDAPEPRRRLGGVGEPYSDGLWYGVPAYWTTPSLAALGGIATDPDDPPVYESEAAFLERLGLLTDEERRRLPADAFEPEVLDWIVVDDDDER
jgi:hypothetical protein